MVHKAITIVLIPNKYYQFRTQHKFIGINFTREKHIGSIAKAWKCNVLGLLFKKIF